MMDKKVIGSIQHWFMKGKFRLTNLIAFHNEVIASWTGVRSGYCLS